jgi:hypothetical protein
VVLVGDHAAHSLAAIEQYPFVAFPRPFELGAGGELFFVGHGTPKVYNWIARDFAIQL